MAWLDRDCSGYFMCAFDGVSENPNVAFRQTNRPTAAAGGQT